MSDTIQDLPLDKMFKKDANGIDYVDYESSSKAVEEGEAIMEKIKTAQKRLRSYHNECREVESILQNRKKIKGNKGNEISHKVYNNVMFSVINTITSRLIPNLPEGSVTCRSTGNDKSIKGYKQAADVIQKVLNEVTSNSTGFEDTLYDAVENLVKYGYFQIRMLYTPIDQVLYNKVDEYSKDEIGFVALDWDEYVTSGERRQEDLTSMSFRRLLTKDKILSIATDEMKKDAFVTFKTDANQEYESGHDEEQDEFAVWDHWDSITEMRYLVMEHNSAVIRRQYKPLNIPGFFPVSRSVRYLKRSRTGDPVTPYQIIKDHQELIDLYAHKIHLCGKAAEPGFVVGFKDEKFDNWVKSPKLSYSPATDLFDTMMEKGMKIEDMIYAWPVESFANSAQILSLIEDRIEQKILNAFGLSDVFMGQNTNGKDGVQTQILKDVQGNNNLKPLQRKVIRSIETLLQNIVCIILKHFELASILDKAAENIDPNDEKNLPLISTLETQDMKLYNIAVSSESMQIVDQQLQDANIARSQELRKQMTEELMTIPESDPETKIDIIKFYQPLFKYLKLPPLINRPLMDQLDKAITEYETLLEQMRMSEEDVAANPYEIDPETGQPIIDPETNQPIPRKSMAEEMQAQEQEAAMASSEENMKIQSAERIEQMKLESAERLKMAEIEAKKAVELAKLAQTAAKDESDRELGKAAQETSDFKADTERMGTESEIKVEEHSIKMGEPRKSEVDE